jgi:hypothetical protein
MVKQDMQEVRIHKAPKKLVNRLKAALLSEGWTLSDWFIVAAAKWAAEYERRAGKR